MKFDNLQTELQTERLTLRRIKSSDWRQILAYLSDPLVTRWLPEDPFDEKAAQEFAEKHSGEALSRLAIIEQASGAFIGHMVFHPWFGDHSYEIGWVLSRAAQGNGFATEAAQALLAYAFDTLKCHRMIATCQPENTGSWKIMEKLGMRREGHFLKCIPRENGIWWDEYFYAILAEEFLRRKT